MQNVVVFAPTSATRKLYHLSLSKREYNVHRVADLAELLLVLVTFEIDTVILVDEGKMLHELETALEILPRKFDSKRVILVSTDYAKNRHVERFASTTEFFDNIL